MCFDYVWGDVSSTAGPTANSLHHRHPAHSPLPGVWLDYQCWMFARQFILVGPSSS